MLTDTLGTLTIIDIMTGDYSDAIANIREADDIAVMTENHWGRSFATAGLGVTLTKLGQLKAAFEAINVCIRESESAEHVAPMILMRVEEAWLLGHIGRFEAASIRLDEADRITETRDTPDEIKPMPSYVRAWLHAKQGKLDHTRMLLPKKFIPHIGLGTSSHTRLLQGSRHNWP